MSFYNEKSSSRIFDRNKMLNPIYKAKIEKIVENANTKKGDKNGNKK